MEKDWVIVLRAGKAYQAELVKGMLKEHDIDSVIINRQDSEFLVGEVDLYVHNSYAEKASVLISEAGYQL